MDDPQADAVADELDALPDDGNGARIGPRLIAFLIRRIRAIRQTAVTLEIVANTTALPQNAGPREFFRVTGGPATDQQALFVGNGPNQPLRRIPTSPL